MKNKQTPTEVQIIAKILDDVIDEYEENNKIIFANESERAKAHFGTVSRGVKHWAKSKRCMVPNCGNRSIARSHTVPKGMSLAVLAENKHVLEPTFNQKTGIADLEKIGLANATTFPGFCAQHELLFEEFENRKSIDTESHVYLQTYRAACRELFRSEFVTNQFDWLIAQYCKARDEGILRIIRERAKQYGIEKVDTSSIKFEHDPLIEYAKPRRDSVGRQAAYLKNFLLPALEKAVFQGDGSEIHVKATYIDQLIPVALAGAASFWVSNNESEKDVTLLMNVVPAPGRTLIIFAGHRSEAQFVDAYEKRWMQNSLDVLSMIESWMINGTDQWCLQPSIWHKLTEERRSALFDLLIGAKKNIGQECELSIFDDLRAHLIQLTEVANANNTSDDYAVFIAAQRKKLA